MSTAKDKEKEMLKVIRQISPKVLLRLLQLSKDKLKQDPIIQQLCQDYDAQLSDIDLVPIRFGDIDVSGTTDHGVITLNYKLLYDKEKQCLTSEKIMSYLVHELTHFFQQCYSAGPTRGADSGEYLKNPAEQEGFQNQIEYIAREDGKEKAEEYVDRLLDHHDVTKPSKKEELQDVLMEKV